MIQLEWRGVAPGVWEVGRLRAHPFAELLPDVTRTMGYLEYDDEEVLETLEPELFIMGNIATALFGSFCSAHYLNPRRGGAAMWHTDGPEAPAMVVAVLSDHLCAGTMFAAERAASAHLYSGPLVRSRAWRIYYVAADTVHRAPDVDVPRILLRFKAVSSRAAP